MEFSQHDRAEYKKFVARVTQGDETIMSPSLEQAFGTGYWAKNEEGYVGQVDLFSGELAVIRRKEGAWVGKLVRVPKPVSVLVASMTGRPLLQSLNGASATPDLIKAYDLNFEAVEAAQAFLNLLLGALAPR